MNNKSNCAWSSNKGIKWNKPPGCLFSLNSAFGMAGGWKSYEGQSNLNWTWTPITAMQNDGNNSTKGILLAACSGLDYGNGLVVQNTFGPWTSLAALFVTIRILFSLNFLDQNGVFMCDSFVEHHKTLLDTLSDQFAYWFFYFLHFDVFLCVWANASMHNKGAYCFKPDSDMLNLMQTWYHVKI